MKNYQYLKMMDVKMERRKYGKLSKCILTSLKAVLPPKEQKKKLWMINDKLLKIG